MRLLALGLGGHQRAAEDRPRSNVTDHVHCQVCRVNSDILRNFDSIIDLDVEIPNGALASSHQRPIYSDTCDGKVCHGVSGRTPQPQATT